LSMHPHALSAFPVRRDGRQVPSRITRLLGVHWGGSPLLCLSRARALEPRHPSIHPPSCSPPAWTMGVRRGEIRRAPREVERCRPAPCRVCRGVRMPPWCTLPPAPLSSRTVGFPESGWQPSLLPTGPSHPSRGSTARSSPPLAGVVRPWARRPVRGPPCAWLGVQTGWPLGRPRRPESPLARAGRSPPQGGALTTSAGLTPPASLLRAHAPHHTPRAACGSLLPRVFAGCGAPLLDEGGARRSRCVSVPRCVDLSPGGVLGALTPYCPTTIGLPPVPLRSAHRTNPPSDFRAGVMSALQACAEVQASRFAATQVAPTAVLAPGAAVAFPSAQNTGRYLPGHRIGSPSEWAMDGSRTSTSLDTQPCRLLQGLAPYVFHACTGVPSAYRRIAQ
jgi:hypothetical protein